jgi:hypothetical protein
MRIQSDQVAPEHLSLHLSDPFVPSWLMMDPFIRPPRDSDGQSVDKITNTDLFANASSLEHIPIKPTNVSI